MNKLLYLVVSVLVLAVSISVHETAHAAAAYFLGDHTASSRNRISLNPLDHIDPFGTIVLPLLMVLAGGPIFAFAKPVPVSLYNLKNPKRDEVLISLAGPLSNILLAVLATGLYALYLKIAVASTLSYNYEAVSMVMYVFGTFLSVNLSLAFFNLIPLPPLDGSSILVPFLTGNALRRYYQIQQYSMPILIMVLWILPSVLHIDLIGMYFNVTLDPVYTLLVKAAFSVL